MIKFHHVGVISSDIKSTILFYTSLGYKEVLTVEDPIQMAKIVLLEAADGPIIELISPLNEKSPAFPWIKRINAGPYHTCYECSDLEEQVKLFQAQGLMAVSEIEPAIAFDNKRIVFLWGKHSGLIELLESPLEVLR
jgi:methylmalonyl-CoA/ethylmalonyl-CoA epimerase